eukprot:CAMPEP_0183549194 /NCGR_PEP_ID=MMETSP0371-20130417/62977_1 /TAXON_ID=268820 /ORGANISM="Peridinium aciculiferum, Strain PAER-2" /LENGTH=64 /DNA_ID=CAMNT_0025752859 /DNA_START=247 /DNA_END=437 /DNA_ORIENTATION=-
MLISALQVFSPVLWRALDSTTSAFGGPPSAGALLLPPPPLSPPPPPGAREAGDLDRERSFGFDR